jgi:hypothetical protein
MVLQFVRLDSLRKAMLHLNNVANSLRYSTDNSISDYLGQIQFRSFLLVSLAKEERGGSFFGLCTKNEPHSPFLCERSEHKLSRFKKTHYTQATNIFLPCTSTHSARLICCRERSKMSKKPVSKCCRSK